MEISWMLNDDNSPHIAERSPHSIVSQVLPQKLQAPPAGNYDDRLFNTTTEPATRPPLNPHYSSNTLQNWVPRSPNIGGARELR